jgi:hypothetical protein
VRRDCCRERLELSFELVTGEALLLDDLCVGARNAALSLNVAAVFSGTVIHRAISGSVLRPCGALDGGRYGLGVATGT